MTIAAPHADLAWSHGSLQVHRLGGMTGPVAFRLPDGPDFAPLATPPWAGEDLPPGLPGHVRGLRGVFPCLPFGISPVPQDAPPDWRRLDRPGRNPQHGPGANGLWDIAEADRTAIRMTFAHPPGDPFAATEQTITPDPERPAVTFGFSARPRESVTWPFGFHVMLAWAGPMRIDPGTFALGLTYPGRLAPGLMQTRPGASFRSLAEVPGREGRIDMTRPDWAGPSEDVVMLCGSGGRIKVDYPRQGRRLQITWDAATLPGCLLWFSRFGLTEAPWMNRYTAIGIEPVAAAFDFLPGVSAAPNPVSSMGIRTAIAFRRDALFSTELRLEAFAL